MKAGLTLYEKLKAKGYLVYYLKAELDGTWWMRLRVGVFGSVPEAEKFGNNFSQVESFNFFVTTANVRVDAYQSEYDIITTPSAIWMRINSSAKELFYFGRSKIETIAKIEKSRPVISPDGNAIIFNHESRQYSFPVRNEKTVNKSAPVAKALVVIGISRIANGDLDNAIEDFNRAIELNPDLAKAFSSRGLAYRRKGWYDHAIADYNKSLVLNPHDAETYNKRGFSWYQKGNLERAIDDFDRAIGIDPQYTLAFFNRGVAFHQKGALDRAIEDCNKVLELNSEHSEAYGIRCLAWLEKGELDHALKDCDQALKLNPQNISAYSTRGVIWLQAGELEMACSDLAKACNLGSCETLKTVKEKGYCH
jgi:tetratricopeptide (TPR) repeat protein